MGEAVPCGLVRRHAAWLPGNLRSMTRNVPPIGTLSWFARGGYETRLNRIRLLRSSSPTQTAPSPTVRAVGAVPGGGPAGPAPDRWWGRSGRACPGFILAGSPPPDIVVGASWATQSVPRPNLIRTP